MRAQSWIDGGFLLAHWEVRPRHGTLLRRDVAGAPLVRIEPRVMAVLTCLARHVGDVVTRDEFGAEVWGGRVVSDEALSRCISLLRQVLEDDSREPRFIRTIARIGYTLVATPMPLTAQEPQHPPAPAPANEAAAPAPRGLPADARPPPRISWMKRTWPRRPLAALLIGGVIVLAAGLALYYSGRGPRSSADALPPPIKRLLVLPLDTRQARSYGHSVGIELADEIADSLAPVERLQISGRRSADAIAATHVGALDAGRKLGADAVLNGEVAERPEGLRVTLRLTAVKDARELWSRNFERPAGDVFAAQSAIAAAAVHDLIGLVDPEGPVPRVGRESRDIEAYQLYLRGAHQLRLRGEDSLRRAVDLFSAAARRDPTYARAQVGLGFAYALLPSYSYEDPTEMFALADQALARADELAHSRLQSAGARGYLGFMRGRWIEAESAFRTAIIAEPNDPDVRQMYSQLLGAVGRMEPALMQARMAEEIDPLAPVVAERLGILNLWLGHDAEAARYAALARELGLEEAIYPETSILLKLHQYHDGDAANDLRVLQESLHRSYAWVEPTLNAYRHAEKRPVAIALLDKVRASGDISARLYFGAMVLLEDSGRALRGFISMPDRDVNDLEFLFSAEAAVVRRDPSFGEFIRKMGIEAYWDRFGWPSFCRRELSRISCH